MENFIAQAVKDGIIQESHLKDLQNGTMTTDRLKRENEDQQSLFSRAGLFFLYLFGWNCLCNISAPIKIENVPKTFKSIFLINKESSIVMTSNIGPTIINMRPMSPFTNLIHNLPKLKSR